MSLLDLKNAYGLSRGKKGREAINYAIRAEIPGGDKVLDRLQDWRHICHRLGWEGPDGEPIQVTAFRHLLEVADAMEDAIRERYDIPARTQREDLRR